MRQILLVCLLLASASFAQNAPGEAAKSVTVTATGTAYGEPDQASFEAGVGAFTADVQVATDRVNERVSRLTEALKAAGVAAQDIRTTNFSVYPEQIYRKNRPVGVRYRVTNTVSVTVRDTAQLGELLSKSVASGANEIYSVGYTFSDSTALERSAREDAMTSAREKAEQLASLSEIELGAVRRIVEGSVPGGFAPFGTDAFAEGSMMSGGVPAPVSGGQLAVTVSVQVTFGLK